MLHSVVRIHAQDNLENRDPGMGERTEQRPAEQKRVSWSSEAGATHTEDSRGPPGPPAQMERWRDARGGHPRVGSGSGWWVGFQTHLRWLHRAVREDSRCQTQRKAEPEMAVRGPGWAQAVGQTHLQAGAGEKVVAHGPGWGQRHCCSKMTWRSSAKVPQPQDGGTAAQSQHRFCFLATA